MTSTVPEPSSIALLGTVIGAAAVALRRCGALSASLSASRSNTACVMIEPLHKNVLALVVGLGLLGGIAQAAELSTSDSVTIPAGTLVVPLTFASGTASISGIQFDIETDPE